MTVKFVDLYHEPSSVPRSEVQSGKAYRDDEGYVYLVVETTGDTPEKMLVEMHAGKPGEFRVFPVEDIMPANGRTLTEVEMTISVHRKD